MARKQIDVTGDCIQGLLADYDRYLTAREAGAGALEEYVFWKSASQLYPEIETGKWCFDTSDPLRPRFVEVGQNEKRYR